MCDTGYSVTRLVADLRELKAHAATEARMLQAVPELTVWQGLRATRLKLWDERRGRLVTFREGDPQMPPDRTRRDWPSVERVE